MSSFVQGTNTDGELIRDAYVEHSPVVLDASHDGVTRQEFAAECDINVLLERYEKTGVINHFNNGQPMYMDLTAGVGLDLMSAMEVLHNATDAFMRLPAKVRREFDNDPVKFVEYAERPENLDSMREWGLAPPAPAPDPIAHSVPLDVTVRSDTKEVKS